MPRDGFPFSLTGAGKEPVRQRTLKNPINCSGTALHAGTHVAMTLHPAPADTGIVFRRTGPGVGPAGAGDIPARYDHVVDTRLCTVIGNGHGANVATIEHLMAALAGAGIDNALIEINGAEVPAMDGSAAPFLFLIECAGVVEQEAPRRVLRALKPVSVSDGTAKASLTPAEQPSLSFEIEYDNRVIARQSHTLDFSEPTFRAEVSRARTYGFLEDVTALQSQGLALGGSLDNAVVVSGERILNENGLRYENEFVRHKLLDAIGDLYLAGGLVLGRFEGSCAGHRINNKLLRALFADDAAWEWADAPVAPMSGPVGETTTPDGRLRGTEELKLAAG